MKAEIGDYIKFIGYASGTTELTVPMISQVVGISDSPDYTEEYETATGHTINETELGIDDVLLASEVEIG